MVPRSCEQLGSAVSGHAAMHSMHCVQFSAMNSGVSRRATYFEAVSPLPAAMMPSAAYGVDGWLYPYPARNSSLNDLMHVNGARAGSSAWAGCTRGPQGLPLP